MISNLEIGNPIHKGYAIRAFRDSGGRLPDACGYIGVWTPKAPQFSDDAPDWERSGMALRSGRCVGSIVYVQEFPSRGATGSRFVWGCIFGWLRGLDLNRRSVLGAETRDRAQPWRAWPSDTGSALLQPRA